MTRIATSLHDPEHREAVLLGYLYRSGQLQDPQPVVRLPAVSFLLGTIMGVALGILVSAIILR